MTKRDKIKGFIQFSVNALYLESHNCCFVFQMPVLYTVTLIAPVYSKHHRMTIVPSPEIL